MAKPPIDDSSRPTSADVHLAARRGYHHGNLKEALIEAARRLIAERGPAGFTLSDAAKLAGVSPAAPYRHFKDRQSLLRDIAQLGFAALGERLGQAAAAGGPQGFSAMGRAYLAFAREEPAYYAAMFNSGTTSEEAKSEGAEDPGFRMLREAVGRALGTHDAEAARRAAMLVFALTHGLASLSVPGSPARPRDLGDPEKLLDLGVDAMLRGLPAALAGGN